MNPIYKDNGKHFKQNQILCCKENGKTLELYTHETSFWRIRMDGGVEKGNDTKKCDFLILQDETEDIWIYVELKGNKTDDAYKQIEATFNKHKKQQKSETTQYYGVIISSSTPQTTTTSQNIKQKLRNQGFMEIFCKNKRLTLHYDSSSQKISKNKPASDKSEILTQ